MNNTVKLNNHNIPTGNVCQKYKYVRVYASNGNECQIFEIVRVYACVHMHTYIARPIWHLSIHKMLNYCHKREYDATLTSWMRYKQLQILNTIPTNCLTSCKMMNVYVTLARKN